METAARFTEDRRTLTTALLPLVAAAIAAIAAQGIGALPLKIMAAAVAGAGLLVAGAITGMTRPLLLGAWTMALTYNRQYFVFDGIMGHPGAQGPYIVVSDAFLALLALGWLIEIVTHRKRSAPAAEPSGAAWLFPFFAVSAVSGALALHPSWSLFESLRLLRIFFLLIYFRYNVREREWWACIIGIAFGAFAQGVMGTAEVATGRSGVLGILGFGNLESQAPPELREEVFYGWRRATGTMSHPPNLACYFMMAIPPLIALAFAARNLRYKLAASVASLAALAGLACTLSRWPIAVMMLEIPAVLFGLVMLHRITLKRVLGVLVLATFSLTVAAISMHKFIEDRISRDLGRSVDFRVQENETGYRIASLSPIWGVGPNNYADYLFRLDPSWEWARRYEDIAIKLLHIRPIASPHDGFLLILAETGILGLTAFVVFVVSVFRSAWRAIQRSDGPAQAVCLGLTVGFAALLLQQAVDFSIWADPLLYMMGLFAALFRAAPLSAASAKGIPS